MSKTQAQMVRLLVIGQATEAGIREQFDRHLAEFRAKYEGVKAIGDPELPAYLLALVAFSAEVQDDV